MSVPLARRQLAARRGRTLAASGGVGVALLLILALNAIFGGVQQRLTAFLDQTRADVIVAQHGVTSIHMSQSALGPDTATRVAAIKGVASARGILLISASVERGGTRAVTYLIGADGPRTLLPLAAGRAAGPGEIVLDRASLQALGGHLGSTVDALETPLRVSGEVTGTASIVSAVALLRRGDLARAAQVPADSLSYVLVRGQSGVDSATLAQRIERALPGVSATTRTRFAASERRVTGDMSTDLVHGMVLVGFIVGVCVAGLVAYTAKLQQLRDFTVLRALGLDLGRSLLLLLRQIVAIVLGGFLLALATVYVLAAAVPRVMPAVTLDVRADDIAGALLAAILVALLAAALPLVRIARVDPASAFHRRSA